MSYNSLVNSDAARLSRWASIGSDNANDSWGSNHGTWLTGPATPTAGVYGTPPTGVPGRAFSTVEAGRWIAASNAAMEPIETAGTYSAWVSYASGTNLVSPHFSLSRYFTVKSGKWMAEYSDSTSALRQLVGTPTSTGWHHLAFTWKAGEQVLYLDGVAVASRADADMQTSPAAIDKFGIGAYGGNGGSGATALISDLCTYTKALSAAEVLELYNRAEPLNLTAPVLATDGTVTSGTWDSQSNGTITRTTYLRLASDDSLVATLFTANPDFSSYVTHGTTYYVVERASNDGGYDEAEDSRSANATMDLAPPVKTWQAIAGQTAKTLTITNVQAGDYGRRFRCVATGVGSATSSAADIVAP